MGQSDILINFKESVETVYQANVGITLGALGQFSAFDIQTIVNTLDIIVFPPANPDGRDYSMNSADVIWRRNLAQYRPTNSGECMCVNTSRNCDFIWDFQYQSLGLFTHPHRPI